VHSKIVKAIRAVGKRMGPRSVKQAIWDREHAQGQWDWAQDLARPLRQRDIVYEVLDRYSSDACILDLGCGNGYSGRMITSQYREYFGVDVSEVAVDAARRDFNQDPERGPKSHFESNDILTFVPTKKFSVILLSDCLPYFALHQVKRILQRYGAFLDSNGVFVVRLYDREKYHGIVEHIEGAYRVLDNVTRADSAGVVLTFIPRQ
jgi:SAM-dependent methyltransferase